MYARHRARDHNEQDTEPMQIGFDARRYFHNRTGLGNYSRNIVDGLAKVFPEQTFRLYDEKDCDRVFRMGRKARRNGCDVFHGLSNELPIDIRKTGIRSIVTIHDVAWRTFPDMYKLPARVIYNIKYGWAARHADHIIAISESTKADIMRFFRVDERKISVLYQPVQTHFYRRMDKETAHETVRHISANIPSDFLLSVGTVNNRKNLLSTLKALASIPGGERPPLVVVGNGKDYRCKCMEFAANELGKNDVIWLDNVRDNVDLQALYTCATALLYPSMYEGFGLPVVEALLQGCPVLTSTVSSLPEAAGPGALLVDPSDQEEMTETLRLLVEDHTLRRKLATEGEDYCRRMFDPDTQARRLMEIYRGNEE